MREGTAMRFEQAADWDASYAGDDRAPDEPTLQAQVWAKAKDEDLKARRQKHIVESPEIVRKHAIRQ